MPRPPIAALLAMLVLATAGLAAAVAGPAAAAPPIGRYTTQGAFSFVSAPGLHPPRLNRNAPTRYGQLAPGFFFAANFPNLSSGLPLTGQGGPLILDHHLQPVWFRSVGLNAVAADLKPQTYRGQPALSWWQGVITRTGAASSGTVELVDQHYRTIATLTGRGGYVISPHEVVIDGQNAWVTAYRYVRGVNLRPYGGARHGVVYDAAVQEYDLPSGKLLYTWDALNPGGTPNVSLGQSQQRPPASAATAWDAYHLNSIQLLPGNRFLVSMRNTWAAYLVDATTGRTVWTLGGRASSFKVARAAQFQWQHQVTLLPGAGLVTVYDDHCCAFTSSDQLIPATGPSRGLILRLDPTARKASLVHQYLHQNPSVDAAFIGSTQLLGSGGNVLVCFGSVPYFSEYSGSGKLLLDAHWPAPDQSFRVLAGSWTGAPLYPPSGAVRSRTVYASWNGATSVARWRVLAGATVTGLKPVASARATGFETAIALRSKYKHYEVQALDGSGHLLGHSNPFSK